MVQTRIARNETNFLFVSVILVTKVTDTTVQVGLLSKNQTCLYLFFTVPLGFFVGGRGCIRAKMHMVSKSAVGVGEKREITHRWGNLFWKISVSRKVL